MNRYSYVTNNPLKYTDPSGHMLVEDSGGAGSVCPDQKCRDDVQQRRAKKDKDNKCENRNGKSVGCIPYVSVSVGLDAPSLIMLTGAGLSLAGVEAGLPIVLAGAALETCAPPASGLCLFIKPLSLNISATIDGYGNLYAGPQISWGKSILPVVAVSDYFGFVQSDNDHVPTESEVRDTLSGASLSIGSIATGGVSYSPQAKTYKTTYYLDGFPEVFSANAGYNFRWFDFSP